MKLVFFLVSFRHFSEWKTMANLHSNYEKRSQMLWRARFLSAIFHNRLNSTKPEWCMQPSFAYRIVKKISQRECVCMCTKWTKRNNEMDCVDALRAFHQQTHFHCAVHVVEAIVEQRVSSYKHNFFYASHAHSFVVNPSSVCEHRFYFVFPKAWHSAHSTTFHHLHSPICSEKFFPYFFSIIVNKLHRMHNLRVWHFCLHFVLWFRSGTVAETNVCKRERERERFVSYLRILYAILALSFAKTLFAIPTVCAIFALADLKLR